MEEWHSRRAEEFVGRFARAWGPGETDALVELLHPSVKLRQPLLPAMNGHEQVRATLSRLIRAFDGIRANVRGWGLGAGSLFIQFDLVLPSARSLRWGAVDRFRFLGGRAIERITYFDFRELFRGVLTRPHVLVASVRERILSLGAFPRGSTDGIDFTRHRTELGPLEFRELVFRAGPRRERSPWLGVECKAAGSPGPGRQYFASPGPDLIPRPVLALLAATPRAWSGAVAKDVE